MYLQHQPSVSVGAHQVGDELEGMVYHARDTIVLVTLEAIDLPCVAKQGVHQCNSSKYL